MIKRALGWFSVIIILFLVNMYIDYTIVRIWIPYYIRIIGLIGIVFSVRLLQLSGRYLREFGDAKEWGVTTKLVTIRLYSCVRHPHHLGIGLIISSLSLLIGGPVTFIINTVVIWILVIWFLKRIEEPELIQKFKDDYKKYMENVPMIIPDMKCLFKEIFRI